MNLRMRSHFWQGGDLEPNCGLSGYKAHIVFSMSGKVSHFLAYRVLLYCCIHKPPLSFSLKLIYRKKEQLSTFILRIAGWEPTITRLSTEYFTNRVHPCVPTVVLGVVFCNHTLCRTCSLLFSGTLSSLSILFMSVLSHDA